MQLCAASVYPDPKIYLGFTMCLSEDYQDIPARNLMKDCALEHGMDFDKLNACASDDDGAKGIEMLRKSVERSAELNVTTSCTVSFPALRCLLSNLRSTLTLAIDPRKRYSPLCSGRWQVEGL